jgi:periplasmic mercuric ion binding protein
MKTLNIMFAFIFSLVSIGSVFAQGTAVKKTTFKVWGNCGMCKENIETAAKLKGVSSASWDEETKQLTVKYKTTVTSEMKIHQSIAAVGYDTEKVKGNDAAYNKLHACCKYERKAGTDVKAACCSEDKCGDGKDACKGKDCCKAGAKCCVTAAGDHAKEGCGTTGCCKDAIKAGKS